MLARQKTGLSELLQARILQRGPITLAEYMEEALCHPTLGYYTTQDPLGKDFTTSPEISQAFGEVLGAWATDCWQKMGTPSFAWVELGPGRGTLMADMLRATQSVPGFHDSFSIHLVERSPALKAKQQAAIRHPSVTWHDDIATLPEMPTILVANEFFDALPVRQFIMQGGWQERKIGVTQGALAFMQEAAGDLVPAFQAREGEIAELSPCRQSIAEALAAKVKQQGGACLILDYGFTEGYGDTLQAMRAGRYCDPLEMPGTADLTTHVDFAALCAGLKASQLAGPVTQQDFLTRLGILHRGARLGEKEMESVRRLIDPEGMGTLFHVMAITHSDLAKKLAGFL